ncbi:MAG: hypothetical protein F6K00_08670 [Leptolyngbya sp. SIOISBB]|nr:hypothetical protein [Leptolyngbya sp. SIOISBB]
MGPCLLLPLLYLHTAVIRGGGGFQVRFVYKPLHGANPFYRPSFGEEGDWVRLAESPNPPWWITGDYRLLMMRSAEGGVPLELRLYRTGYRVLPWLWAWATMRLLWRSRHRFHSLRR